jgi:hypothetical protein
MIAEIEIPEELRDDPAKIQSIKQAAMDRFASSQEMSMLFDYTFVLDSKIDTLHVWVSIHGQSDYALTEQLVACVVEEIVNACQLQHSWNTEKYWTPEDSLKVNELMKLDLTPQELRLRFPPFQGIRVRFGKNSGNEGQHELTETPSEIALGTSYTDWDAFQSQSSDPETLAPLFTNHLSNVCAKLEALVQIDY